MDNVGPLRQSNVTGRFAAPVERALAASPTQALATARVLAGSHFPESLVADVLQAAGLDADLVLDGEPLAVNDARRRSTSWRRQIVEAWDRQCAFCGYDGHLGTATVGLDAAHVRWFSYGGPDEIDNGLALCTLHHKLFDRGALGLDDDLRILVSSSFTARTEAGRGVYDLHGKRLSARPGTPPPADAHVSWHVEQVFKGASLAADGLLDAARASGCF